ncbi:MAG: DUF86 domain-containing protein [Proteobacteria bacterium]|nr:DUF86 domain-containing protein [Pseudomonadota bacterium]
MLSRTRKETLSLSLIRLLEIIGKAANGVSMDSLEKHPQIPWKKMIGLRNRLVRFLTEPSENTEKTY